MSRGAKKNEDLPIDLDGIRKILECMTLGIIVGLGMVLGIFYMFCPETMDFSMGIVSLSVSMLLLPVLSARLIYDIARKEG